VLQAAEGRIKTAVLMILRSVDTGEAEALLSRHDGILRAALAEGPKLPL
jgi:N-acetylmuramic acid 6-phosphate (MurNAc-6-P) etherase